MISKVLIYKTKLVNVASGRNDDETTIKQKLQGRPEIDFERLPIGAGKGGLVYRNCLLKRLRRGDQAPQAGPHGVEIEHLFAFRFYQKNFAIELGHAHRRISFVSYLSAHHILSGSTAQRRGEQRSRVGAAGKTELIAFDA